MATSLKKNKGIYLRSIAELDSELAYIKLYIERINEIRRLRLELIDGGKSTTEIMNYITNIACSHWKIKREELFAGRGSQTVSDARFAIFHVARNHTQLRLGQISGFFNMDHGSVIHGLRRAEQIASGDKHFAARLNSVAAEFVESLEAQTTNK